MSTEARNILFVVYLMGGLLTAAWLDLVLGADFRRPQTWARIALWPLAILLGILRGVREM